MESVKQKYIWALLRLSMGWIFLWAFLDKLFGLNFATVSGKAWLDGVSPTAGFLNFAVKGPFAYFFKSLAGNVSVDWLYMMGLLFIGLCLILGIFVRLAAFFGGLMLFLFYLAGFLPPKNNPFLDEHFVYLIVMVGLAISDSGKYFGLGEWWAKTNFVRKYDFFK